MVVSTRIGLFTGNQRKRLLAPGRAGANARSQEEVCSLGGGHPQTKSEQSGRQHDEALGDKIWTNVDAIHGDWRIHGTEMQEDAPKGKGEVGKKDTRRQDRRP